MTHKKRFDDLLKLAKTMRKKSFWHREQTIQKWSRHVKEEAGEIGRAVRKKDWDNLREEIGDMMWDLAFLAEMANEQRLFSIHDSIQSAHNKVVRRNPHVFAGAKISSSKELQKIYNEIKRKEKEMKRKRKMKKISKKTK